MQTEAHALILYHLHYDNTAYAAVTDAMAALLGASDENIRDTPDYIALSNLLTNAALEICGYPPYQGQGWQLAITLRKLTEARREAGQLSTESVEQLFSQMDAYLMHFAAARRSFDDHLQSRPQAQAAFELQGLGQLLADAIRRTNGLASWQGRAAYHLTSASAGLLQVAHTLIQHDHISPGLLYYMAEKLSRAQRDTRYGLDEILQQDNIPPIFARVRDALRQMEEK